MPEGGQGGGVTEVANEQKPLREEAWRQGKWQPWCESQGVPWLLCAISWDLPRPEQTVASAFVMPPTWVQPGLASCLRPAAPTP